MLKKLEDYSEKQLKEMIPPQKVAREFGLNTDTLSYMRECSRDEGKLRGPLFIKDDNIILYQRKSVVVWLHKSMFSPAESAESTESTETTKSKKPKSNLKSVK